MTVQTIQQPTPNGVQPMAVSVSHAGLDMLHRWVSAADEASQLVARIIRTPFVPDSYRPQIDPRATAEQRAEAEALAIANGTAAVLQGISVGLDPLTALQNIYIIHGRPGMYAEIMVALVQSAGHEVWTEETSGTRAVVSGRRKGSDAVERVVITMEMARAAGWVGRNKNYQSVPADMLWARAAGRVCKRIGADVLHGIASVEEVQDNQGEAVGSRKVQRSPARQAIASSAAAAEAQASAELDQDPRGAHTAKPARSAPTGPPLPGEDDGPAPLDKRQWDAINREFVRLEVTGEGQTAARLTVISHLVGRQVGAGRELVADEGQFILDNLAGDLGFEVVAAALGRPAPAGEPAQDALIGDADPDTDDAAPTDAEWAAMTGGEAEGDERT